MDPQLVREREARCIQEQPPACNAACPVHVDVRAMVECAGKGDFRSAFAVLARHLPLPGIIARICDHPCEAACRRAEAGDPLRIGALEQACAEYGSHLPRQRPLAPKSQRVAVVGGGLSGLSAAVDLASKGYTVVVFEAKPRLLDRIRQLGPDVIPEEIIDSELSVLDTLGVEIRTNAPVSSGGADLGFDHLPAEFDAIYTSVLLDGETQIDPVTYATSRPKIFAGGAQRRRATDYSPIQSLADGKYAALSIDRFLQKASLSANRDTQGPQLSRLYVKTQGIEPAPAVVPNNRLYSREEAIHEASRCFPCNCLECVKVCEFLRHYRLYPKRYVREIYNNDSIIMGAHKANRMVNSCTLCGLCETVCPEKLSMAEVCLEARESMVCKGKMPPSAHEFALRDMAFSTGSAFALARHQPGFETSTAIFFPGCQLSGSSPGHVARTYELLCEKVRGGVGLLLGCCGAPAHWAGRLDLFDQTTRSISETWVGVGRPRVITACSSCYRMFKDHLPEIPVESLWPLLQECGPSDAKPNQSPRQFAIHDPCTTRHDDGVQDGARQLLAQLNVDVLELNERGQTTCCGYGGLVQIANPEMAARIVDSRIATSNADYVTYCAMCRDSFARQGKRAVHILDLYFESNGADPALRPDPGYSQRQENRARLKTRLQREVWRENVNEHEPQIRLKFEPEVLELMERRMILVDDVRQVIEHAEKTGARIKDTQTGRFIACYRPGCVTYWVEYSVAGTELVVRNAYSHRMQVG